MLIRLTGPVEVRAGSEPHRISASKQACVLAVLADRPGVPVPQLDLIHRVWDADPPESALAGLYSYVTKLRAVFRDSPQVSIKRAGTHGYVLEAGPETVDVHLVRDLASRARTARDAGDLPGAAGLWREACELVRGEALVGVGGRWAEEFRAGFRREHVNLLTERYAAELDLGNHDAIVDELATLVVRRPLAETLVAHLMRALYRCGRATEALACFDSLRERLRERLGTDPSAELRDLHVRVLRQDPRLDPPRPAGNPAPAAPASARPVPAQLPADTTGFVGRDAEIAAARARSSQGGVLVIDGMAGVGKTALALRIGHRLAPEFPDGQLFVDLRGYAADVPPLEPAQVLERLLRSLDTEVPEDLDARAAALRTALAGRRLLTILDNARDSAQVAPLLPGIGDSLTLVTSRRRLVDLVDAQPVSLKSLDPEQAARLFAAEAGVDGNDPATADIAAACGGLPLAVRLAASRLRNRPSWTTTDLLRRLTTDRAAVWELDVAGRGVAAAFALSYQDLDQPVRRLFRLLSVFPGPDFDRHIAACVADIEPDDADAALEHLVDVHLLIDTGPGRYRIHDLLRQFAARQLSGPERADAWRRLADGYVWAARHAIKLVDPSFRTTSQPADPVSRRIPPPEHPREAEAWFQTELPVVELVFDAAEAQGLDAHVVELCLHVQTFLMHHFQPELGLRLAEQGLAAAKRLDEPELEARLENQVGLRLCDLSRYEPALIHLRRCLGLWRELGHHRGQSVTLNNIARIHDFFGEYEESAAVYERAAEFGETARSPEVIALARSNLAGVLKNLDRTTEALSQLDQVDAIMREVGNEREQMRADWTRALVLQQTGDHDTALRLLQRVEAFCREHHDFVGLNAAMEGMAETWLHRGQPAKALALAQEQLNLLADNNHPFQEAKALHQVGAAQAALGHPEEAVDSLRAAAATAHGIGTASIQARCDHTLGEQLHLLGHHTEARTHLERALDYHAPNDSPEAAAIRDLLATLPATDGPPP